MSCIFNFIVQVIILSGTFNFMVHLINCMYLFHFVVIHIIIFTCLLAVACFLSGVYNLLFAN